MEVLYRLAAASKHTKDRGGCPRFPEQKRQSAEEVRSFRTTTRKLLQLGDWLLLPGPAEPRTPDPILHDALSRARRRNVCHSNAGIAGDCQRIPRFRVAALVLECVAASVIPQPCQLKSSLVVSQPTAGDSAFGG
jgi:hypothetical protein